jgi:hypothetical protein
MDKSGLDPGWVKETFFLNVRASLRSPSLSAEEAVSTEQSVREMDLITL